MFDLQVTYAEPELVTGLSSQPNHLGGIINNTGDINGGSGGVSFPNSR